MYISAKCGRQQILLRTRHHRIVMHADQNGKQIPCSSGLQTNLPMQRRNASHCPPLLVPATTALKSNHMMNGEVFLSQKESTGLLSLQETT